MYDNLLAAIAGAVAGAARYSGSGLTKVATVFFTGFLLSYYIGSDVVLVVSKYTDVVISYAAIYFLLAYFGPVFLDKITAIISSYQVTKRWK